MPLYRLTAGPDGSLRPRPPAHHDASTANDMAQPTHPLAFGAVVAWRSRRTNGFGQVQRIDPDGRIVVQTWLPSRTHRVTVDPADVVPLLSLEELPAILKAAACPRPR
jgi:hypothetical protein